MEGKEGVNIILPKANVQSIYHDLEGECLDGSSTSSSSPFPVSRCIILTSNSGQTDKTRAVPLPNLFSCSHRDREEKRLKK